MCLACALVPIGIWGALRFSRDGIQFFSKMVQIDLLKRITSNLERPQRGMLYYVTNLVRNRATIAMTLLSMLGILLCKKSKQNLRMIHVSILGILVPIVLFSLVKTKVGWYVLGIFPPLFVLAGLGVQSIVSLKKPVIVRVALLSVPLILLILALLSNISTILSIQPSALERDLLAHAQTARSQIQSRIYKDSEAQGSENWQQKEVLLMEWVGNYLPREGGVAEWMNDADSLLLIQNDALVNLNTSYELKITGTQYSIVEHTDAK